MPCVAKTKIQLGGWDFHIARGMPRGKEDPSHPSRGQASPRGTPQDPFMKNHLNVFLQNEVTISSLSCLF